MVIRFTSTLTPEDETCVAPALLKAVGHLLEPFPISYSLRIETSNGVVVEDGRPKVRSDASLTSRAHQGHGANPRRRDFGSEL
jgi:hypothetical protein